MEVYQEDGREVGQENAGWKTLRTGQICQYRMQQERRKIDSCGEIWQVQM